VYSLNPALTEMLTTDRQAEIQRQATQRQATRRQAMQRRRPRPSSGRVRSLRKATGWALVEIGLRLAVPRRTSIARTGIARRSIARSTTARRGIDRRQSALPVAR
jgi:hypothetical protein